MPIQHHHLHAIFMLLFLGGSFPLHAELQVTLDPANAQRLLAADGLPNHQTGNFPNRHNPNRVRTQHYQLSVPLSPRKNVRATPVRGQPFGIALNGVLFDPGTAETWRNNPDWRMEAFNTGHNLGLDEHHAHVQPNGAYHYHGIPTGLLQSRQHSKPTLLGYAADGFPIYAQQGYRQADNADSALIRLRSSYRLRTEPRNGGPGGMPDGNYTRDFVYQTGSGDLDVCNGRFALTPEYPQGTYHYVITDTFPYIPRCWMGTPDASFAHLHEPPRGRRDNAHPEFGPVGHGMPHRPHRRDGPARMPPPEAIQACRDKKPVGRCTIDTPHGRLAGICLDVPGGEFACVPDRHIQQ